MKKPAFFAVLFLLLSAGFLSAQPRPGLERIDADARRIDAFAKKNRPAALVFADASTDEKQRWRRFAAEAALEKFRETQETYTIALGWRQGKALVHAIFTRFSASGDWAQYDSYYYRPDGSLAKIASELRTFYGSVIVLRDFYFDPRGRRIGRRVRYRDLNTNRPVAKPEGDYNQPEIETYRRTKNLPFARLLPKR